MDASYKKETGKMANKAVRLLHAMMQGTRSHQGTIAIDELGGSAATFLQEIADELDWRVVRFEASQVNLNDLEVPESPLSQTLRHAVNSDHVYVLILQDMRPAAMEDDEHLAKLERLARSVRTIVTMREPPARTRGWRLADLRA